MKNQDYP